LKKRDLLYYYQRCKKKEGSGLLSGSDRIKVSIKVSIKVNIKVNMLQLRFEKSENGLLPAIAQDYQTGEILMLAYINPESWQKTVETGKAHYWSRSRNTLWLKGESSGHVQLVREILVDCDEDTVVFKVEQLGGAACHTGHRSCFFRRVDGENLSVVGVKVFDPAMVYGKK
jgi:phosphoribosyl-AMP cyclohydrolase